MLPVTIAFKWSSKIDFGFPLLFKLENERKQYIPRKYVHDKINRSSEFQIKRKHNLILLLLWLFLNEFYCLTFKVKLLKSPAVSFYADVWMRKSYTYKSAHCTTTGHANYTKLFHCFKIPLGKEESMQLSLTCVGQTNLRSWPVTLDKLPFTLLSGVFS